MKTSIRLSLAILLLMLVFNPSFIKEAKAQSVVNEILKRMEIHQNALFSIRSKVTMVKYNNQLKEFDTLEGTTIYSRTAKNQISVRTDWAKPVVESLFFVNDQYVLYRPRLKQALIWKIDEAPKGIKMSDALTLVKMSRKQVKTDYIINYIGDETLRSGTKTWHLVLTPKKAAGYQSAEFWVDGNGMPIQVKVVEPNNDATTILLSDFKKNEAVNSALFQITLPKGTKMIVMSSPNASANNIVRNNKEKTLKNTRQRKRVGKLTVRKKRLRLWRVKTSRQ